MPKRKCEDWLDTLLEYVEDTESPRQFWMWSGLTCITSAFQRKVWLPFGMENIYPNLYVLIVGPPGVRKGRPASFLKKTLQDIKVSVFADSPTKRALTQQLAECARTQTFAWQGSHKPMSALALISKELSSFMAVDIKAMVEVLTDLFDSHDEWEYKTSGVGKDVLYGVCLNCFFCSTPMWIAANLPPESIGGGFTSRFVIVYGDEFYKYVPVPPPPNDELLQRLRHDLAHIATLKGEFKWTPEAYDFYVSWYKDINERGIKDDRLVHNIRRSHIQVFKTAMALHCARSDELRLELSDLQTAVVLIEQSLKTAGRALRDQGTSTTALSLGKIMDQLKFMKRVQRSELLRQNFHNTNKTEFSEIIETLVAMKCIRVEPSNEDPNDGWLVWLGAPSGEGEL